ncbi:MAG: nucleotidyl transferase AbiEii/AbiGii toxin family protein [Spirochaetia bacterium]
MNTLFDDYVQRALEGAKDQQRSLLPAIEKEILHHDIIRELHEHRFLSGFILFGGTNLRLCHGSNRLSEDLDFKGGPDFDPAKMSGMASVLTKAFGQKYGLVASVEDPRPKEGNTKTWTIRIITRPGAKSEKQQRIDLDVCTLTAYEHAPAVIANHYAIDLGTSGLVIRSQSTRESLTDKVLAIALRNRLQPRDLWDFAWLCQKPANRVPTRVADKLQEHGVTMREFSRRLADRIVDMKSEESRTTFVNELTRFLPAGIIKTAKDPTFWEYLVTALKEEGEVFGRDLSRDRHRGSWEM